MRDKRILSIPLFDVTAGDLKTAGKIDFDEAGKPVLVTMPSLTYGRNALEQCRRRLQGRADRGRASAAATSMSSRGWTNDEPPKDDATLAREENETQRPFRLVAPALNSVRVGEDRIAAEREGRALSRSDVVGRDRRVRDLARRRAAAPQLPAGRARLRRASPDRRDQRRRRRAARARHLRFHQGRHAQDHRQGEGRRAAAAVARPAGFELVPPGQHAVLRALPVGRGADRPGRRADRRGLLFRRRQRALHQDHGQDRGDEVPQRRPVDRPHLQRHHRSRPRRRSTSRA